MVAFPSGCSLLTTSLNELRVLKDGDLELPTLVFSHSTLFGGTFLFLPLPHSKLYNSEVYGKKFPSTNCSFLPQMKGGVCGYKTWFDHPILLMYATCPPPPKKKEIFGNRKNCNYPPIYVIYIYICCLCVAPSYTSRWHDLKSHRILWFQSYLECFSFSVEVVENGKGGRAVPWGSRLHGGCHDVSWCENVMGFLPWFQQHPKNHYYHMGVGSPEQKWPCTRVHNRGYNPTHRGYSTIYNW